MCIRDRYLDAVKAVDAKLGQMFAQIAGNALMNGNTTIILSADHGGTGTGHSTQSDAANYVIEMMLWGPGVPANTNMYVLNGGLTTDPGATGRPDYALGSGQPIRNGDGGNCALRRLGLSATIPGSSMNNLTNVCELVALPATATPTPTPTATATATSTPTAAPNTARFAVVGDFGANNSTPATDVSNLIRGWNVDFVTTVGDNNYCTGNSDGFEEFDLCMGRYYYDFMKPYSGTYGAGASVNKYWPALGNHDWDAGINGWYGFMTLPNNERYYELVRGPVHFFFVDSDTREPDGTSAGSTQGVWLQTRLAASTSPWKVVVFHHPPYSSSSTHGSSAWMQWPFQAWGATAVLNGHDHTYERIVQNGFPYFVNGLGGHSIYNFGTPVSGSVLRYNGNYGAMLVTADSCQMTYQFITRLGAVIDTYTQTQAACATPTPTATATATASLSLIHI